MKGEEIERNHNFDTQEKMFWERVLLMKKNEIKSCCFNLMPDTLSMDLYLYIYFSL